ncbi:MAG TPA: hypothetical protein V6D17_25315 [Candidatus Obscuribacterales bacterium]
MVTPEEARKEARILLASMAAGHDPAAERRAPREEDITLLQAFDTYPKVRHQRASTVSQYRQILRRCFSATKSMT